MKAEISRLAAQIIQNMSFEERIKFIPYIEKANTLNDIPEPWRSEMRKIQNQKTDN